MLMRRPSLRLPVRFHLARRSRPAETAPYEQSPDPGSVLVLSGGGRMGAVQVGILRALSATGFRPAAVIGTSAGAFNATFLAFYPEDEGHARLRAIWEGLAFQRIFNRSLVRTAYSAVVRRNHLCGNGELRALIQRNIQPDEIRLARIPLHIVATNLHTGEKAVFSSGSVMQAVLASSAIPGLFPPIAIDGQLYVDGGITANLDLETAVALGARHIVAIDTSARTVPTRPRTVGDVVWRSLEIALRERTFGTLERLESRARITLLRPGPLEMARLGQLRPTRALLDAADRLGDELVARALDPQGHLTHGLVSTEPLAPLPALVWQA